MPVPIRPKEGHVHKSVVDRTQVSKLRVIPLTLSQANVLVTMIHRHHKKVTTHKFSIGLLNNGKLVGACVVSKPVARNTDQYMIAEVSRLVTDGTKNACSMLYASAARICKEMGYAKIQTYILDTEPGTSLIAAGWECEGESGGGSWNNPKRGGIRFNSFDQPHSKKMKYAKVLNTLLKPKDPAPSSLIV